LCVYTREKVYPATVCVTCVSQLVSPTWEGLARYNFSYSAKKGITSPTLGPSCDVPVVICGQKSRVTLMSILSRCGNHY